MCSGVKLEAERADVAFGLCCVSDDTGGGPLMSPLGHERRRRRRSLPVDFRYAPLATEVLRRCEMS